MYSILYHDELLEGNKEGHMKKDLQGVYCHKLGTSRKAENYVVFENVFSNGHWWGALLDLSVDRAVSKTVGDQMGPACRIRDPESPWGLRAAS